jgi:hypothetical protein
MLAAVIIKFVVSKYFNTVKEEGILLVPKLSIET